MTSNSTGYLALIKDNSNYRNLWIGQIISLLGDWFNLIASASLIAALTQSGLAIGGLFVVRMLAPFLVSPIAGVVVDRYNRKTILLLADIFRGITVFGFLLVREPEHVWLLYVLTAIQLGISGFFFPGRNAILPDVVSKDELGTANALGAATWSTMLALGAALGGFATGSWGIYPSFIIDGLTFFLSAVFIYLVKYQHVDRSPSTDFSISTVNKEYIDGLKYLVRHKDILVVACLKASVALSISGAFQVIQVRIAESIFVIGEGGAVSLGLMYAVVGAGTGFGPILARKYTGDRDRPLRIATAWSYLVAAAGFAIIAPMSSFPIVLVGTLLRGLGGGIIWVFSTQLLLQLLPDRVRGRVFSTEFAMMTLMSALAAIIGGWGMDHPKVGLQPLLWWLSGLTLMLGALWAFWLFLRRDAAPEANIVG